MAKNLDLGALFQSVTNQLTDQKESLNEADTYNHDHGDHMVDIFNLVQKAVSKKTDKPVAEQLEYASKVVEKEGHSGSSKLYAQGLASAAKNFSGADLNQDTIGLLVKSLLNAEKPEPKPKAQGAGGLLGSLLSGLTGQSRASEKEQEQELGVDDLIKAGLAFYQSKQEGDSTTAAMVDALMAASPLGQTDHRKQSGSIVASSIMNFATSFLN
ncbi:MAG: hypothetical protein U9R53_05755 [Chloroflexota bacterium]|nr:hypothetical protein [Chloroflexota bacterium]